MNYTILDFAVVSSGILGYFISISLLTTSFYKSLANRYLAFSLFLLSTITLLGWYDAAYGVLEFLQSIMWEFLVAVTIFAYFLTQIGHPYLDKNWYKWLYFPFIITLLVDTFLHLDFNFDLYNSSFEEEGLMVQLFYALEDTLSLFYNIALIFWARKLIQGSTSISDEKRLWLLRLNLFIICIIVIWLLSNIEDGFLDSTFSTQLLWGILSFFSWWILYYGIFRLQVVSQKDEIHKYLSTHKIPVTPLKKKKNDTTTSKIIPLLYQLMEEEELYKNPLLSRLDIAKRLGISEGYLSQIVNQEINKSIVQFVNEYRIESAKALLHNPIFNKYSIEAIGMEAGFKSKSVFYDTFKTYTGKSPGAYKKLQKKS